LVKYVVEAILLYWMTLAFIPKGVLDNLGRISYIFLWSRSMDKRGISLVKWKRVIIPKEVGGWGLKNIFKFSIALSVKSEWRLISNKG
jgi:hypothetical protein